MIAISNLKFEIRNPKRVALRAISHFVLIYINEVGKDLRTHDEPFERLPSLPERPRSKRRKNGLVERAGRSISSQFGADTKGPCVFWRVWRPRRRVPSRIAA